MGRRVSSSIVAVLHLVATLAVAIEPAASEPTPSDSALFGPAPFEPAPSESAPSVSEPAASEPSRRAVALYQEGEYRRAADALENARRERPRDAEAALLLGLTRLRLDEPAEAARQWRDAIELGKGEPWAGDLRRSLTLVAREADRRDARSALASGAKSTSETDEKTIAVMPFRPAKSADLAPLARALSAFLAANLAALPGVTVVDPDRVDVFITESGDAERALTDGDSARRLARALGAGRVIIGTLEDFTASPTRFRLAALLFEAGTKREVGRFDAEGPASDFHTLVPTLAPAIGARVRLDSLGADRDSALRAEHTREIGAATAFGRARELFAKDDYSAARDELERALREDPDLRLARELEERLPAAAVSLVAVGNSVESAVLPTLAKREGGGGPSGRTLLLLGGAAVAAGAAGIALAVGGGGGGGGGGDGGGAPTLEGVSDGGVAAGEVFRLDVTGRDPEGSDVILEANLSNVQPGATFTILSDTGGTKTGRLEYRPTAADVGVHAVTFTVRDRDDPPQSASATARITVTSAAGTTPTPGITPSTGATPTATRTRTPSPSPTPTAAATPSPTP